MTEQLDRLWELRFSVEVSARYHDWRQSTMEARVRAIRGITFLGALITLLTAFNPFAWTPHGVSWVIGVAAVIIAGVNLWDLIANYDGAARAHAELHRRFKLLQSRISAEPEASPAEMATWEAEAQVIRADEPPTKWAIYAQCWNQTIDRHQTEVQGYYRKIADWRHLLRNIFDFKPQDFPPVGKA